MDVRVNTGQCSFSGDAVLTTSYADDTTTRGSSFVFEKNIAIATGQTAYVLFDYRTYHPEPGKAGIVYILGPTFQTTAGKVIVTLYRDTDYTGGTPIVAYNPNTISEKRTSATTITVGASGASKGTAALEYLVGGNATNQNTGSGNALGLSFFIRNNQHKSLVEIVNGSGEDITFHYGQVLFEI